MQRALPVRGERSSRAKGGGREEGREGCCGLKSREARPLRWGEATGATLRCRGTEEDVLIKADGADVKSNKTPGFQLLSVAVL